MRFCRKSPTILTIVATTVAVTLSAAALPIVEAHPLAQQIRMRPDVEAALEQVVQMEGVAGRIASIAADTNGRLTVAAVTFTSAPREQSQEALQAFAGRIGWAALSRILALDEVQLVGVEQDLTGRATTAPVIFSAAINREEFNGLSAHTTPRELVRPLPRVWYANSLHIRPIHPTLRGRSSRRVGPAVGPLPFSVSDIYRGDRTRPTLALTFDDGPFPIYTTLLLDTLAQMGVKATFFLVGENVQHYPYLAQAIVQAGHEVANHSFHHPHLTQLSAAQMAEELVQAQDVITAVTGQSPRYFRPPYGEYSSDLMQVAHDLGLSTVFWTAGGGDYASPSGEALKAKVLRQADSGGIVLLHEGVPGTMRILPHIAEALAQRGFTFTTVGGLMASRLAGAPGRRWTPGLPRAK